MPTNFVLIDSPYDAVVAYLKKACPLFPHSPEYALVADNDDLPGVVLAAFGRFLSRLCVGESAGDRGDIEGGVDAINALESWNDYQVRTALRDEFLEALDDDPDAIRVIRPLLNASLSRELPGPKL